MKKIQLDTFMDFRMLSSLTYSPDGSKLAYILTGIDREKKEYISRLRLRVGDRLRRLEEITGWFDKYTSGKDR